jgi:mannose/fructose/N-acetylgalactosamine-specific phosphotransferase system component IIC
MKRSVAGLLLAVTLGAMTPAAAAAAEVDMGPKVATQTACEAGNDRGGAAALAALVAAAVDVGGVVVCDVDVLNNSLNNLLQNADIHVLENILNNSPILNDLNISDITVEVLSDGTVINVLGSPLVIFD